MPDILRSWKTTLAGIAMIGLTVLLIMGKITVGEYLGAFGFIAGGGLLLAKDGAISGAAPQPAKTGSAGAQSADTRPPE
jgi:hypothetical protein